MVFYFHSDDDSVTGALPACLPAASRDVVIHQWEAVICAVFRRERIDSLVISSVAINSEMSTSIVVV